MIITDVLDFTYKDKLLSRKDTFSTNSMPVIYFTIIGPNDTCIYEVGRVDNANESFQLMRHFMTHSSLDMIEEAMWTKADFYLTKTDKIDDRYYVSAFVGYSPVKLLLLEDQEPLSHVRPFFIDAHELVVKYILNPFASATQPVKMREFDDRMTQIFNRYF